MCDTEVVVIRAPKSEVQLQCGGTAMVETRTDPPTGQIAPEFSGGTQIGKRYVDEGQVLEVLCTKAGEGSLALDGRPMVLKDAKALPTSD